jgi:predicted secreted Zn-dependent protease
MKRALVLLCFFAAAPSGGGILDLSAPAGYVSSIRFYSVTGTTPEDVDADLRTRGPEDESGARRFAVTEWNLTWRWRVDGKGAPDLNELDVRGTVHVLMPRLEGSPHLLPSWNRWMATVLGHERNHVAHLRGSVTEVREALRSSSETSADELNRRAKRIVRRLRQIDEQYDRATRNGWDEGVSTFSEQSAVLKNR